MKKIFPPLAPVWRALVFIFIITMPTSAEDWPKEAFQLRDAALKSGKGFERLAEMCDRFGHRMAGSKALEDAIDWILVRLKEDGFENVHGEEVPLEPWIRGKESCVLIRPVEKPLHMLGLGGSVGTGTEAIEAECLVVRSFDELELVKDKARGRIVVFNEPFTSYRTTVAIRVKGAVAAAKAGAVASLIRSVGPISIQSPHTGMMLYESGVKKIPHAALSVEDAEMLQRMQDRGEKVVVKLNMEAHQGEPTRSRNVIAEIVGREKPEEIVLISGHIDSWDVGQGAMDDGGGCLVMWEAARLMKELGLHPRRTIRLVLWTNEENGLDGAKSYREKHRAELARHVIALESDEGVFAPEGFNFTGSTAAMKLLQGVIPLLRPLGAEKLGLGAGGSDIGQLLMEGVPIMDLKTANSRYFWYHHTAADTMDKLNETEFRKCVAATSAMIWGIAEMPTTLPR